MGIEDSDDSPRSTPRPGSAASREALAVPPSYLRPDDDSDTDSAYGEDSLLRDDTRTLATYMTEYRYEFGRRYHAFRDGAYWVREIEILNLPRTGLGLTSIRVPTMILRMSNKKLPTICIA